MDRHERKMFERMMRHNNDRYRDPHPHGHHMRMMEDKGGKYNNLIFK